jgi:DNA mismatch repair protein MutS2
MIQVREDFEKRSQEAQSQAQKHAQAFEELSDRKKELLEKERGAIFGEIKKIREEVAELIENLKRDPSMKAAVGASQRLKELQTQVQEKKKKTRRKPTGQRGKAVNASDLREGDRVLVTILGKEGEVTSVDRHSGMIGVTLGAMRTRVAVEQVRLLEKPKKTKGKKAAYRPPVAVSPEPAEVRTTANTLDLRGTRVDEALDQVDKFLDQVFGSGEAAAFIIHGHGTGALKAAVRAHLKDSPYPQHFRTGTPEEGGDGITVVRLK